MGHLNSWKQIRIKWKMVRLRQREENLPSYPLKITIDIIMYSNASKVPNLFFKKDIYYLLLSSYKHIEKFISRRCSIRYMC